MSRNDSGLTRRQAVSKLFAAAAAASLSLAGVSFSEVPALDHDGRVNPPRPVPDVPVRTADGASTSLAALLRDHSTALHLVFTECTTTCPIQGAVFQRVQRLIPDQIERRIQLLSLSIDPTTDTPESLKKWLDRFHARPGWIAALPRAEDVAALRTFFNEGGRDISNHTTQVQIVNPRAELIWRTQELPSSDSIAAILGKIKA
ncbi:MAG: SCO family protein [Terriglobales bacterium]